MDKNTRTPGGAVRRDTRWHCSPNVPLGLLLQGLDVPVQLPLRKTDVAQRQQESGDADDHKPGTEPGLIPAHLRLQRPQAILPGLRLALDHPPAVVHEVRAVDAITVTHPDEVGDEIRYLLTVLAT